MSDPALDSTGGLTDATIEVGGVECTAEQVVERGDIVGYRAPWTGHADMIDAAPGETDADEKFTHGVVAEIVTRETSVRTGPVPQVISTYPFNPETGRAAIHMARGEPTGALEFVDYPVRGLTLMEKARGTYQTVDRPVNDLIAAITMRRGEAFANAAGADTDASGDPDADDENEAGGDATGADGDGGDGDEEADR